MEDCKESLLVLFVVQEQGKIRTTALMVWKQNYTHSTYVRGEANKHTVSWPSFSCFCCGGCFCRWLAETREQPRSALWCLPQNWERREGLTVHSQPVMERILNRLKHFNGCFFGIICFEVWTWLAPDWRPNDHRSLRLPCTSNSAVQFRCASGSGHFWYSDGA